METLKFGNSGWCKELKQSYEKGIYTPKNEKEFNILKRYALKPQKKSINKKEIPKETSKEDFKKEG